jgi:hypothetical protein
VYFAKTRGLGGIMEYVEVPSGGGESGGTAFIETVYNFETEFSPGTRVYSKDKALHAGKLEKAVIKQINIVNSVPLYIDMFGHAWNEDELVLYDEAVALAITYYTDRLNAITS